MRVVGEKVFYASSIGIDVHKDMIVCCFGSPGEDNVIQNEVREFATNKKALQEELVPWAVSRKPETIIMESTGVYWIPVFRELEEYGLTAKVVNARHVRMIPGKKTDTQDAAWLSQIGRMGYLKGSFIVPKEWREIAELSLYRQQCVADRTKAISRISRQMIIFNCNLTVSGQ